MTSARHILAPLSSDGGDAGSSFFDAFVLEVDDKLQQRIDAAWVQLEQDPFLDHIGMHVTGFALPGADNHVTQMAERDKERLYELLDDANGPRRVRVRDRALLSRCAAYGAQGEVLRVYRYVSPVVALHDKGDYEGFSSSSIDLIMPRGLKKEQAAMRRRHRRFHEKTGVQVAQDHVQ